MIQANELRIGNLVNCHFLTTNFNAKVLEIKRLGVVVQDGEHENMYSFENISGIPITPEILEKCGFVKSQMGYEFEGIELELFFGKLKYKYGNEIRLRTHIQYVHQLQNLYHILCGTELNVQL